MKKTFLKKGVRELWGRKLQYLFLVLVLGLGVGAYGSLENMHGYRQASFNEFYEEGRFNDLEAVLYNYGTVNRSVFSSIMESPDIAPYVKEVEYRLIVPTFINVTDGGETHTVKGLVYGYEMFEGGEFKQPAVNRPLRFNEGGGAFPSNLTSYCYLERAFAKAHGLLPGEKIEIIKDGASTTLAVLDHVNFPEHIFVIEKNAIMPSERTLGIVGVPIATARALARAPGSTLVNSAAITLCEPARLGEFRIKLAAAFDAENKSVEITAKEENAGRAFMKADMKGDETMMGMFPVVIFAVSGVAIFMSLRKIVQSHRSQIGVFKALGVPDRSILGYFLIIGLLVAVSGTMAGLLISIPLDMFFQNIMDRFMELAVSDYPVSMLPFVKAGAISLGICVACALLPAISAVRMKPLDAIQSREGTRYSRVGKAASRFASWHILPTVVKVTLRNTLRKPARNASTILGVAMSLALFLSFAIVFETSVSALDGMEAGNAWDYEITTKDFVPASYGSNFSSFSGVESADAGLLLPTRFSRGGAELFGQLTAVTPLGRSFNIKLEEGGMDGGIVIGRFMADKLGVGVGDQIAFDHPVIDPVHGVTGQASANITVCGIHASHMGILAFAQLSAVENATGLSGMANVFYLRTAGGEALPALESSALMTEGVLSVTYRADRENLIAQYFDIFLQATYIIAVVSIVMAGAIVYTLFKINVEDGRRDYATMKTLGASTAKLGYLVYLEAAVVTLPGLLLGAVGGQLIAMWMFSLDDTFDMANMHAQFSWLGFAIGAGLILLVVAGVVALMLRYISKINIADVIRERSS